MNPNWKILQMIWGIALASAGAGLLLYVIPIKLSLIIEAKGLKPSSIDSLFMYFSVGLMAVILIGAGVRKIYGNFKKQEDADPEKQP